MADEIGPAPNAVLQKTMRAFLQPQPLTQSTPGLDEQSRQPCFPSTPGSYFQPAFGLGPRQFLYPLTLASQSRPGSGPRHGSGFDGASSPTLVSTPQPPDFSFALPQIRPQRLAREYYEHRTWAYTPTLEEVALRKQPPDDYNPAVA